MRGKNPWRSVEDDPPPLDMPVYVWRPEWHGRGNIIRTIRHASYWENDFFNGSAPSNFNPKWWMPYPPTPPSEKCASELVLWRHLRRFRARAVNGEEKQEAGEDEQA